MAMQSCVSHPLCIFQKISTKGNKPNEKYYVDHFHILLEAQNLDAILPLAEFLFEEPVHFPDLNYFDLVCSHF